MRLILKVWPALVPIFGYMAWLLWLRLGGKPVKVTRGAVFWVLLASAGLAIVSFLVLALTQDAPLSGHYDPPAYAPGGVVEPGRIEPGRRPR